MYGEEKNKKASGSKKMNKAKKKANFKVNNVVVDSKGNKGTVVVALKFSVVIFWKYKSGPLTLTYDQDEAKELFTKI